MTMTPEARVAVESFRAEAMIDSAPGAPVTGPGTAHMRAASAPPAKAVRTAMSDLVEAGRAPRYIVTALGRQFRVSAEMAAIFLRQVERVVESDSSALVVLRHEEGVELLLVTDDNSFSIHALPQ